MPAKLTLCLLWIVWSTLHSFLVSRRITAYLRRRGGLWQGGFRLFYISFSLLSLLPLIWYQFQLPQQVLFQYQGTWRLLQALLLLYAFIMFYGGKKVYDMEYFLGLKQWREYRAGALHIRQVPFRRSGLLRHVRHPWYSGGLALLWAAGPLTDVNLISRMVLSLYLVIGAMLEEQKLKEELGHRYVEYCRQVPMLIPWKTGAAGNDTDREKRKKWRSH
ncbi:methyltransferase family protein [Desulfolithobacter sp.]